MLTKEQLLSIERPQPRCTTCESPIGDLDHHPTRLLLNEEQSRRDDYCPECWEKIKGEAYDSYWQTRRIRKEKRVPRLSRREKATMARALFESLWDQRDREDLDAHLFFLSHLLLKWGGLRWRSSRIDEQGLEIITFENPASNETLEIRSTELAPESLDAIKERVESFLRDHAPETEVML